jgi:hypothetical protein
MSVTRPWVCCPAVRYCWALLLGMQVGIGKDTEYRQMSDTAAAERRRYLEVEMELTPAERASRLARHESVRRPLRPLRRAC